MPSLIGSLFRIHFPSFSSFSVLLKSNIIAKCESMRNCKLQNYARKTVPIITKYDCTFTTDMSAVAVRLLRSSESNTIVLFFDESPITTVGSPAGFWQSFWHRSRLNCQAAVIKAAKTSSPHMRAMPWNRTGVNY